MSLISDYYKRKKTATWHYSQFVIFLAILDNDSQFMEGSSYIETLQLQYEIKGEKIANASLNGRQEHCSLRQYLSLRMSNNQHVRKNTCHLSTFNQRLFRLKAQTPSLAMHFTTAMKCFELFLISQNIFTKLIL